MEKTIRVDDEARPNDRAFAFYIGKWRSCIVMERQAISGLVKVNMFGIFDWVKREYVRKNLSKVDHS